MLQEYKIDFFKFAFFPHCFLSIFFVFKVSKAYVSNFFRFCFTSSLECNIVINVTQVFLNYSVTPRNVYLWWNRKCIMIIEPHLCCNLQSFLFYFYHVFCVCKKSILFFFLFVFLFYSYVGNLKMTL